MSLLQGLCDIKHKMKLLKQKKKQLTEINRDSSADSFINAFGHGKNIALVKRFECVTLK